MRLATLAICLLIACASHAELTIFEVQRNLPLSEGEKIHHDFYVDGGGEAGLKVGMIATVRRKRPLFDYYRNREVTDLQLDIAKVKVIQVQDGLAVVRLKDEATREDAPISDEAFIMVGDHLEISATVADSTPAASEGVSAPVVTGAKSAARIVVNSVDLTIEEAKAPAAAPAPPAEPAPK